MQVLLEDEEQNCQLGSDYPAEIAEALIGRRKYNHDRLVKNQ